MFATIGKRAVGMEHLDAMTSWIGHGNDSAGAKAMPRAAINCPAPDPSDPNSKAYATPARDMTNGGAAPAGGSPQGGAHKRKPKPSAARARGRPEPPALSSAMDRRRAQTARPPAAGGRGGLYNGPCTNSGPFRPKM